VLGIPVLTEFVGQVLSFIPRLLEGMIIIIIGYVLAKYVQGQVIATKVEYSELIGRIIFFLTIIIVISLALPFFGIDPSLINNIILILVGSVGLGIAIALGLGLKDTIARLAKKYSKKL
jgi:asparagine N-glycosylation enzyme membrane subunit Stt3